MTDAFGKSALLINKMFEFEVIPDVASLFTLLTNIAKTLEPSHIDVPIFIYCVDTQENILGAMTINRGVDYTSIGHAQSLLAHYQFLNGQWIELHDKVNLSSFTFLPNGGITRHMLNAPPDANGDEAVILQPNIIMYTLKPFLSYKSFWTMFENGTFEENHKRRVIQDFVKTMALKNKQREERHETQLPTEIPRTIAGYLGGKKRSRASFKSSEWPALRDRPRRRCTKYSICTNQSRRRKRCRQNWDKGIGLKQRWDHVQSRKRSQKGRGMGASTQRTVPIARAINPDDTEEEEPTGPILRGDTIEDLRGVVNRINQGFMYGSFDPADIRILARILDRPENIVRTRILALERPLPSQPIQTSELLMTYIERIRQRLQL